MVAGYFLSDLFRDCSFTGGAAAGGSTDVVRGKGSVFEKKAASMCWLIFLARPAGSFCRANDCWMQASRQVSMSYNCLQSSHSWIWPSMPGSSVCLCADRFCSQIKKSLQFMGQICSGLLFMWRLFFLLSFNFFNNFTFNASFALFNLDITVPMGISSVLAMSLYSISSI